MYDTCSHTTPPKLLFTTHGSHFGPTHSLFSASLTSRNSRPSWIDGILLHIILPFLVWILSHRTPPPFEACHKGPALAHSVDSRSLSKVSAAVRLDPSLVLALRIREFCIHHRRTQAPVESAPRHSGWILGTHQCGRRINLAEEIVQEFLRIFKNSQKSNFGVTARRPQAEAV